MKTYSIGDRVWHASHKTTIERITCPECFGKLYLTVILGDDSKVTIDCAGCASGYGPPKGYVTYYKHDADIILVTIDKVEISLDYVEYGFNRVDGFMNIAKDTELFIIKEEAEIRAKELSEEWDKDQLAKIHQKEKHNHTWSWHVHYHRKQIRDAEKMIEYAKTKLDVAKTRTK